jgi:replicative DNA helicase
MSSRILIASEPSISSWSASIRATCRGWHEESLFREMTRLGGPHVIARIEQLAAQSGRLAKDTAIYVDEAGPATPERIESKAERWRQKRNARDLGTLYFRHLDLMRHGQSIDPALQLLW